MQSHDELAEMGQSSWQVFLVLWHKDSTPHPAGLLPTSSHGVKSQHEQHTLFRWIWRSLGVLCEGSDSPVCEQGNRTHFGKGNCRLSPAGTH